MKRIGLSLHSGPHHGGSFHYGRSLLEALKTLPRDAFSLVVFYSDPAWEAELEQVDCVRRFVEQRSLPMRLLSRSWREAGLPVVWWRRSLGRVGAVNRSYIEADCDLWIFATQESDNFMVPVPSLGVVFDLMHRYEPRFPEVSRRAEYRSREKHFRSVARFSEGVLVDSEVGRDQFHQSYGMPASRIHVLPFVPSAAIRTGIGREDVRMAHGLPEKFLFYPAQFWRHKNHELILQALAQLKEELPDLHVVFAGSEKNNRARIGRMIVREELQDHVTILGYVPDAHLRGLYRLATALVMPTFFGPTNIPPLEAMAVGCPVAVSNIYGMPEQVGDAGLLFDPNDAGELAGVIRRLWTDGALRDDLAARGLAKSGAWGPRQFSERLEGILHQVLS